MLAALGLILAPATGSHCRGEEPSEEQVLDSMRPYAGSSVKGVDASTLTGKVMCGYQGWFAAEGDGLGRGWFHYWKRGRFRPGNCSIDLWPDVSELDEDEKYPTAFRHADGSVACVFSSMNRKTVVRHFKWMQDYGIDGVFVQRFTPRPGDVKQLRHTTAVLANCREGANRHGRTYAVMYDTHFDAESLRHLQADWKRLIDRMQITGDPAYLHHHGKPVIALWGFGFTHRRWDAEAARALIEFLKNDPRYGGLTVVLGVPAYWRALERDCRNEPAIHEILLQADVVSPWSVGRFGLLKDVAHHADFRLKPDLAWCEEHGKDYLPVVFPGFSWHNMQPEQPLDQIPRVKGQFLWRQVVEAHRAGATMLYVAMFDELDEGTAIFKCSGDPPVGDSPFSTYEGLPSDHYLWLTGISGRLIRGETEPSDLVPNRGTREFFPPIRISAPEAVSRLDKVALEEICRCFGRMFVNPVEQAASGERFHLVLGTPESNPRIKRAVEQGLLRLPQGKNADQGYSIKTAGETIYLAANGEWGLLYGANALLESYGACFQIGAERLPDKREFSVTPLDVCVAPTLTYRGILPWDKFVCGTSGNAVAHYRELIDWWEFGILHLRPMTALDRVLVTLAEVLKQFLTGPPPRPLLPVK